MMIAHRRGLRRGITLVELMAAMATLTMILALCAALLTMLMRLDGSGRDHVAHEAKLARLARAFRTDVRESTLVGGVDPSPPSTSLSLPSGDLHAVEYSVVKGSVVRTEWWDDDRVAQERFTLPASASPRFEKLSIDGRTILSLVLDRRSVKSQEDAASKPYRIEAAAGEAHRFSAKGLPSR